MPLFNFACPQCQNSFRKLLPKPPETAPACPECGTESVRDVGSGGVTTKIVETLDNGMMQKRIERIADIERLHAERNQNAPNKTSKSD